MMKWTALMIVITMTVMISLVPNVKGANYTMHLGNLTRDILADAYVANASRSTNYGSQEVLNNTLQKVNPYNSTWVYMTFNTSNLTDLSITNATLGLFQFFSIAGGGFETDIHHVYTAWGEDTITWNNQPCGLSFNESGKCNLTATESKSTGSQNGEWNWYDITSIIQNASDEGADNVSIAFRMISVSEGFGTHRDYFSRETNETVAPYFNVSWRDTETANWSSNQSTVPSEYNPSNYTLFNVTWNDSDTYLDTVYIESNWSGSAVNYTMTNDTYENDTFNYSLLLGAGTYYWKSWANNSLGNWNATDQWTFTIAKNSTNYMNVNATLGATTYSNADFSTDSNTEVKLWSSMQFSDGGTALLYVDGSAYTNPNTRTWGVGTYTVVGNTTGNDNYTANGTGISITMTITGPPAPPPAGGGGGNVEIQTETVIEQIVCGDSICSENETYELCPLDCKKPIGESPAVRLEVAFLVLTIIGGVALAGRQKKKRRIKTID